MKIKKYSTKFVLHIPRTRKADGKEVKADYEAFIQFVCDILKDQGVTETFLSDGEYNGGFEKQAEELLTVFCDTDQEETVSMCFFDAFSKAAVLIGTTSFKFERNGKLYAVCGEEENA